MRVLLVKMSSLGDVVHTLAAITDAAQEKPGVTFDWVIEEAYADIASWHPAVRRIIPIALRRWRRSLWEMIRENEWFRFRGELRRDEYDLVLDAQGLMKSGWIGLQGRGPLAGRSRSTAREPLAAAFYKKSYEIDLALPELEQLRQLFALALDYAPPTAPASFGIDRQRITPKTVRDPAVVFAHGAAWRTKLWPVEHWQKLGRYVAARGLTPRLPWGNAEEKTRAESIAAACGGEVLPKLGIPELARVLAESRFVVGLDTGLTHISIALGTPTVTLYGPSVPVYREVAGGKLVNLASSTAKTVDTDRPNTVALEPVIRALDSFV